MRNGLPSWLGVVVYSLLSLPARTASGPETLALRVLPLAPSNPLRLHALQSHDLATDDMVKGWHALGGQTNDKF